MKTRKAPLIDLYDGACPPVSREFLFARLVSGLGVSVHKATHIINAVTHYDDMLLALEEVKAYLIKTGRQDARSYVEQIAEVVAKAESSATPQRCDK